MDARVKPGHDECFLCRLVQSTASRSRRAIRARFAKNVPPSETRGRRECRARDAPAASCVKKQTHELVTTVTPERPGIPRAMVLRLTSRSPRRSGLLSPSSALLLTDLTPASGHQNHTTSPYAAARFVKRTARVHRIPPRVRDVRTPLCRDGTANVYY